MVVSENCVFEDPWWPGIIAEVIKEKAEPTKYLVNFIGDNSQYMLHLNRSSTIQS